MDSKDGAARIQAVADAWLDVEDPGDHNQAVMELGALSAPPKPQCQHAPLSDTCLQPTTSTCTNRLPAKTPKKKAEAWARLTWMCSTTATRLLGPTA